MSGVTDLQAERDRLRAEKAELVAAAEEVCAFDWSACDEALHAIETLRIVLAKVGVTEGGGSGS